MAKNIAILTLYYRNANYGGILQAYALQKALESLGCNAKQISYELSSGYEKHQRSFAYKTIAGIYHYVKYRKWMVEFHKREKILYEFADTIPHTRVVTSTNIVTLADAFDLFICGSDQIWNPIGWQPTLFFDFLPDEKKRVSYAASVARDQLSEEELFFMKRFLDKFTTISVRETNTAQQLNSYLGDGRVRVMPDPVLLLSKDEWSELQEEEQIRKPFIIVYMLGEGNNQYSSILKYAKEHRKEVKFISHMNWNNYEWEQNYKEKLTGAIGIERFLRLISDADLVITDSFHGTVFSAIFNVPFVVLERQHAIGEKSMSTRLKTILKELGCPNRMVQQLSIWDDYQLYEEEKRFINKNIKYLQNLGREYLKEVIL